MSIWELVVGNYVIEVNEVVCAACGSGCTETEAEGCAYFEENESTWC